MFDTLRGSAPRAGRRRPVIGVTTQTLHAIAGIPEGLPESWVMNQRYFRAAIAMGAIPWMIPLLADDLATLREIYERLDGLLIPGGVDMDPTTYGEAITPEVGRLDPARDAVELQLTRWAFEDGLPLLGLCRGAQVMNVARGGSLYQDIPAQLPGSLQHDCYPTKGFARAHLAHDVELAPGSRLREALEHPRVQVNSMHHQSVKTLGEGLMISAVAPDGVVEAVESTGDAFQVGVQWQVRRRGGAPRRPTCRPGGRRPGGRPGRRSSGGRGDPRLSGDHAARLPVARGVGDGELRRAPERDMLRRATDVPPRDSRREGPVLLRGPFVLPARGRRQRSHASSATRASRRARSGGAAGPDSDVTFHQYSGVRPACVRPAP
jgi:putative glutamine amidotransferase